MSLIIGLVILVWLVGVPYWYGYFTHFDKDSGGGAAVWPVVLVIWGILKAGVWLTVKGRKRAIK